MGGIERQPRRPAGWPPPGPPPAGPRGRPELSPGPDEELSYLCGDWRLFQKRRGHRWSVDDLLTAWLAVETSGSAHDVLDLGCGLGSVLLLTAFRLPAATFVGIEAQADRAAMARRSIDYDGVSDRCRVMTGDLRTCLTDQTFDLITGTPPYFPPGTGPESAHAHAAPCRFEHRGGVEAYLAAAYPLLRPGGAFVMCSAALASERKRVAASAARLGWFVNHAVTVVPREGKAPLLMVEAFQHRPTKPRFTTLTVRDAHGQWTPEFALVRRAMGLPVGVHHSSKTTKVPLSSASPHD